MCMYKGSNKTAIQSQPSTENRTEYERFVAEKFTVKLGKDN